jgi:hypothetical protein
MEVIEGMKITAMSPAIKLEGITETGKREMGEKGNR